VTEMGSASRSLRILMTADAAGGVWQYCVDIVRGLKEKGAGILLATLGPRPSAQQREQITEIGGIDLRESDYALEWMHDPWSDVDASGEWLLKLQSEFNADVLHLNGYSHAALPWNRPVLVTAHSCVFSWWRAVHGCTPGPEWAEYRHRITRGLEAATQIVAPTAAMARALRDEYGVPYLRTKVIHNFSALTSLEPPRKQMFCLAAGRLWDAAKNLQLLDEIGPRLDWPVRVAGSASGPDRKPVQARSVELLGILGHESFLQQLRQAAIFLHPALYEPFGLSVLEAARSHCCLVLSDIPTLRELWDGAAIFVDPRRADHWVAEANRLSRDPGMRAQFAGRAYARANSFCREKSIDEYLNIYRELSQAKRARGAAA